MKETKRGSEKLMAAWKARALTQESVQEIAKALEESSASVDGAYVVGGQSATGVRVSLSYDGDDVPQCGNDILFWLKWHRKNGGSPRPPRIIIDGTPWPDLVKMQLDFGHVDEAAHGAQEIGELGIEVGH